MWQGFKNLVSLSGILAVSYFGGDVMNSTALAEDQIVELFQTTDLIEKPESVYFYKSQIYVSNMGNGGSTVKDGNGWISQMGPAGEFPVKLFKDLNAPKGMRAKGDLLYFTDIDEIVVGNLRTYEIEKRIPVPNAGFLNDLILDEEGNIFASDMTKNLIYKVSHETDELEIFIKNLDEMPNGLLIEEGELFVASWSGAFRTPGNVYKINLETKAITSITTRGLGNLDGIEKIGDRIIVSDWSGDKIIEVNALTGEYQVIIETFNPADIGLDHENEVLYVPSSKGHKVTGFQL